MAVLVKSTATNGPWIGFARMQEASESAFVTGGSGFIGSALIRRLVGSGTTVRALARSPRAAAAVEALGAEPVHGELSDLEAMAAGADGCAAAFHLAAHLGTWGRPEDFMRDNVAGTENALAACRQAGVERFVHCGTEAALIAGDPLRNVDETAPLRPDSKALYPATKALAEQAVRSANAPGFETVVLRPRFVWGRGDTTLLPQLVQSVESGRFAWIDGGRQLTDTTHVENVVEGLLLAARKGRPGEAYFVTDGEPVVFREFVSALLATQGVEAPKRSVPASVAGPLAAAAEATWRLLRLGGEPPLTRFAVWIASQECTIDISKARRELGFAPVKERADGLAELRR
jgi:nucleoside-diphosphate-sugar epimerase